MTERSAAAGARPLHTGWPLRRGGKQTTSRRARERGGGAYGQLHRHPTEAVPNEALCRLLREADEHRLDARWVPPVGYWLGDAHPYCVHEAPDAASARPHHAERGLACDDLHEIAGVPGSGPMSAEADGLVRAASAGIWPTLPDEYPRLGGPRESPGSIATAGSSR